MLKGLLRGVALLLTLILGVSAILASYPRPEKDLRLKSDTASVRSVWPGEEATLAWIVYRGGNARLSTTPPETTVPALKDYPVDREGELTLTVLADTTVRLETDRETTAFDTNAVFLEEVPADVCARFDRSPFGYYEGLFEQTSPTQLTVGRELSIRLYSGERIGGSLRYEGFQDVVDESYSFAGVELNCELTDTSDFVCRGRENETQQLIGRLTQRGFEGTFEGLGENGSAQTSGTFLLIKQP